MHSVHRALRGVFDDVAELYDRARPDYPPELFSDLVALTGLESGSRVLDIACGTGQATMPFARAGYRVTGVELGSNLAAVARRNLARFPRVDIEVAPFEQWAPGARRFDLVVCATAFHWLDPECRLRKVGEALRPRGAFAIVDTVHVDGGSRAFFESVQACYRRWDPATPADFRMPTAEDTPMRHEELATSALFDAIVSRRYFRELSYTADQYVDLLRTYSAQAHLPATDREALYRDIHALIEDRFDGHIRKMYLTQLNFARRAE